MDFIWSHIVPWARSTVSWLPLNSHTPLLECPRGVHPNMTEEELELYNIRRKERARKISRLASRRKRERARARDLHVYSGYITLNGTDSTGYSLPYQGVVGSMKAVTVLDKQYSYLSQSSDATLAPVAAGTTFTLPPAGKANETQYANTVYPTVVLTLAMGSAEVRADVVNAKGKTIGQVLTFPAYWNPRGTFEWNWDGALSDGSYAPAGTYKITLRALKIYGNSKKPQDWETQTTESFTIKYAAKNKREFTA
ncbi:hypothetical protein QBC45DRAFT_424367 [Copromyces sp. CBS 386.78]|nr:hypothetical protein QBC45DRAFT_424367 [Copromyces sp. CBS 386.78]